MRENNKKSESVVNVFNKITKQYVNYFGRDWEFINEIKHFTSFLHQVLLY